MLRVDDCVVLRRVSMGGGEENPEPPTEAGSRRTSNGSYANIVYSLNKPILNYLYVWSLNYTSFWIKQ